MQPNPKQFAVTCVHGFSRGERSSESVWGQGHSLVGMSGCLPSMHNTLDSSPTPQDKKEGGELHTLVSVAGIVGEALTLATVNFCCPLLLAKF